MSSMKFQLKNLGYIASAEVELANFNVIFGKNNTGKTYVSYTLYSFFQQFVDNFQKIELSFLKDLVKEFIEKKQLDVDISQYESQRQKFINQITASFSKKLHRYFATDEAFFDDFSFRVQLGDFSFDYSREFKWNVSIGNDEAFAIFKEKDSKTVSFRIVQAVEEEEDDFPKELFNTMSKDISSSSFRTMMEEIFANFFRTFLGRSLFPDFPRSYVLTSERAGITLFWKELDINKNVLLDKIFRKDIKNQLDFLKLFIEGTARYAEAIHDNINIVRDFENLSKEESFIVKGRKENKRYKAILQIWSEILTGSFEKAQEQIIFRPKNEDVQVPIYISSSASKNLLLLDFYIKHFARKGDILFIDEPEMNLHPENQRKLVDLLVCLSNIGIKIFITTHSDYILRELNNLIMLANIPEKAQEHFSKKFQSPCVSPLAAHDIKGYIAQDHTLIPIEIDEEGMNTEIFDTTITLMNKISDALYYFDEEDFDE